MKCSAIKISILLSLWDCLFVPYSCCCWCWWRERVCVFFSRIQTNIVNKRNEKSWNDCQCSLKCIWWPRTTKVRISLLLDCCLIQANTWCALLRLLSVFTLHKVNWKWMRKRSAALNDDWWASSSCSCLCCPNDEQYTDTHIHDNNDNYARDFMW